MLVLQHHGPPFGAFGGIQEGAAWFPCLYGLTNLGRSTSGVPTSVEGSPKPSMLRLRHDPNMQVYGNGTLQAIFHFSLPAHWYLPPNPQTSFSQTPGSTPSPLLHPVPRSSPLGPLLRDW